MARPLRSQLPSIYGPINTVYGNVPTATWPDSAKWLVSVSVPNALQPYWRYQGGLVRTMQVNRDMAPALYSAWSNIITRNLEHLVQSYDGCLAIRPSRTDARQSVHSWALAIDINASTNKLGMKGSIAPELVQCFTDAGFVWGGVWAHPDPMHFQYVTEDK